MSNHPQANNVMKATQWQHQNNSLHEGFAGLKMLEFHRDNFNQTTMFRFDKAAGDATHEALFTELMPRIRQFGNSVTVDELNHWIANETPADVSRNNSVLADLKAVGEVRIVGSKGQQRQKGPMHGQDRIVVSRQPKLFLPQ